MPNDRPSVRRLAVDESVSGRELNPLPVLPVAERIKSAGNGGGIAEEIDLLGLHRRLQLRVLRQFVEIAGYLSRGLERLRVECRKQSRILVVKRGHKPFVMAIGQRLGPFAQRRMDLRLQLVGLCGCR